MLFNTKWHSALILLGMLSMSACVNEEYDLSKEIDTDMTFLKNVSLPVGSVGKVAITDILTFGKDQTVIKTDSEGDYIFSFVGDEISENISLPSFNIAPAGGIHTEPIEVHFGTGSYAGLNASFIDADIYFSDIAGKEMNTGMDIELDSELPEQIVDIRSVAVDASINLNFNVNSGVVNLKKGFVFDFPEYLNVIPSSNSDTRFEIYDNHKVTLKEDVAISSASPLVFALKVDKITPPESAINDGRLVLYDDVNVTGDFYLSPADFNIIPKELIINIKADITDLEVLSADIKLDIDETVAGTTVDIGAMPDFLTDSGIVFDIYNPALKFDVVNSTPLSFGLTAAVSAQNGTKTVDFTLGEKPAITIPAQTTSKFVVSRRNFNGDGIVNIVEPKIGELINMLPETVSFKDIRLTSTSDYMTVTPGASYQAAFSYEVYAPLAFGYDFALKFEQDVTDLGLSIDADISKIAASLKVVNSIPLNFTIKAKALDASGELDEDVTITVDKSIIDGTHLSPQATEVTLTISSRNSRISFDGLRLEFEASGPGSLTDSAPPALNINQGFEITDLVLTLPEGITITGTENE